MAMKRPKNLLLDRQALNKGEDYCREHGTTLSRLVEDFLLALPGRYEGDEARSAIVQELMGAAMSGPMHSDWYREFQSRKQRRKGEDDRFSW